MELIKRANRVLRDFYTQCNNPKISMINQLADEMGKLQEEMVGQDMHAALLNIINVLKWTTPYLPLHRVIGIGE